MVSKCSVRNPGLTRFRYRKLRSIKPAPHNKSSARPLRRPQGRFVAAGLAHTQPPSPCGRPEACPGAAAAMLRARRRCRREWWPAWPPQPRKRKPGHSGETIRSAADARRSQRNGELESPFCQGNGEYDADANQDESFRQILTQDRKSTRLNSSHTVISYAVFCLKKKKKKKKTENNRKKEHKDGH